jgi:hypothetical protein
MKFYVLGTVCTAYLFFTFKDDLSINNLIPSIASDVEYLCYDDDVICIC